MEMIFDIIEINYLYSKNVFRHRLDTIVPNNSSAYGQFTLLDWDCTLKDISTHDE